MIFIFLDGVGIGKPDDSNPFYLARPQHLKFYRDPSPLAENLSIKPIDPLLDTPGLPQSASGQTSLFSGINVPALLGKHSGSFPNREMRKILYHHNILSQLKERRISNQYINAYPVHDYLFSQEHIQITDQGKINFSEAFPPGLRRKISVTSCMMITSNSIPNNERDIVEENALYQDFSNKSLINRGLQLPVFTPQKAGEILHGQSKTYDFILYEYFQTDMQGHRGTVESCTEMVSQLDLMIHSLTARLNPGRDTLMITSDHGNLEDCSTRQHTLNMVPLFAWGLDANVMVERINKITDVVPAICHYFDTHSSIK